MKSQSIRYVLAFATLALIFPSDSYGQTEVLWTSYHDGFFLDFEYDDDLGRATLVTRGEGSTHFYTQG